MSLEVQVRAGECWACAAPLPSPVVGLCPSCDAEESAEVAAMPVHSALCVDCGKRPSCTRAGLCSACHQRVNRDDARRKYDRESKRRQRARKHSGQNTQPRVRMDV